MPDGETQKYKIIVVHHSRRYNMLTIIPRKNMKTIITNSSTISSTALCEDQTPHTIRKSAGTAVITLQ
jgi:hypothetical protein